MKTREKAVCEGEGMADNTCIFPHCDHCEKKRAGVIKIGLKSNAAFLFGQMKGNTLGGTTGEPYWRFILHLNKEQFEQFKVAIIAFGGNIDRSLTKTEEDSFADRVDYDCYFTQ